MDGEEDAALVPLEIFVKPCVNGSSTTGTIFNFSLISECTDPHNCTLVTKQPGAFPMSPILLGLTGITGQLCALVYIYRSDRRYKHKTVFYIMLATLIWTDLIGKLITTPEPITAYVMGYWIGGAAICNLHGYSMSLIGLVTHLLVAVMAFERLLGVRHGFFYSRVVTNYRTRLLLISIWLFSMMFCSGPLIGLGEFRLHYPGTWCHLNQHVCQDAPLRSRIFLNLYSTINLSCLIFMVVSNFIVVVTLMKMRVKKFQPSGACPQRPKRGLKEREVQMVILLLIITIIFVFSWAPHDLLMFKNQLYPPPPFADPLLDIRAIRLVSLNQIIDPWAYIISRIIFRSKLWKRCRKAIFGRSMIRRNSSSRSERSGSVLDAFIGSKRNSRNHEFAAEISAGKIDSSSGVSDKEENQDIEEKPTLKKKISQVRFNLPIELSSKGSTGEHPTFLKKRPFKQKLQSFPRTISSLLTCGSLLEKELEDSRECNHSIYRTLPNPLEEIALLHSSRNVDKDIVEFGSLIGRSNSWCGSVKLRKVSKSKRSLSLETLGMDT